MCVVEDKFVRKMHEQLALHFTIIIFTTLYPGPGKIPIILGVAVGVTAIIVITVVIALLVKVFCYCRKRRMVCCISLDDEQ